MKIIIGHYHLNPGGVTKIIQSQLEGLSNIEDLEILVVCDGQGFENITLPDNASSLAFEKIGYLPDYGDESSIFKIVGEVLQFFKGIAEKEDIIHFHNIGLGKNVAVSYALYLLAKEGYKVINHAHDFPEDRPTNYKYLEDGLACLGITDMGQVLYPKIDNYKFGVLNSFDSNRLETVGVQAERIQLWPNPVSAPSITAEITKKEAKALVESNLDLPKDKMLVAYPVRVIRRKNIGEYILLAAAFADTANFIVTLPPLNPIEKEVYDKWVTFCQENDINLIFEAGMKLEFDWVMKGADVCFTTSIMEGFGMVFVEPWLWGTAVAGREIHNVIPDLKAFGITYPLLYSQILVQQNHEQVDFPSLDFDDQMKAILDVKKDKSLFKIQNPEVTNFFAQKEIIFENNNKEIISKELSVKQYGNKLHQLYKTLS